MLDKTGLDDRITTAHRAKLAYVYARQSTAGQVRYHQESTELQYRLVNRAMSLGWPRDRVEVVDEDLGKSGASSEARHGFQRLIAEIGLAKAGLLLSLDASRLARNNRDWHQLLELCALFGVLIADGERLYDPHAFHDRLLLDLSGIVSEAELHQIQIRLHQGERQKAARGELRMALPAGLARSSTGAIILNADEGVQARFRLVFDEFRRLQSVKAVTVALRRADLQLPVRPLVGPEPHEVVWREATASRVLQILKNPAYAGAYVYGRRRQDPCGNRPGATRRGTTAVAIEDWPVCLREAHTGYISWGEFMANQKRLADNVIWYDADRSGVARRGSALLQGIALCGRCRRHMHLHGSGSRSEYPVYLCEADYRYTGQPVSLSDADRSELEVLAENTPQIWHAPTTTVADRKQILRLLIRNVVLDKKRESGMVWIKVIWQTGATSEHSVRRSVHSYRQHSDLNHLQQRIRELNAANKMDAEIAVVLNHEGFLPARKRTFSGADIYLLRKRWSVSTVKINRSEENPDQWPDGSYSVKGAAKLLGITEQTVFKWLHNGRLTGQQLAKGMPWRVRLPRKRLAELSKRIRERIVVQVSPADRDEHRRRRVIPS
jgi:excisionase family DNA binding protein